MRGPTGCGRLAVFDWLAVNDARLTGCGRLLGGDWL